MDRNALFILPDDAPRTFDKDETLPALPLPKLEDTMKRYYESLKPFGTEEELKEARRVIDDFVANDGRRLQKLLEKRAATTKNWVSWSPIVFPKIIFPKINFTKRSFSVRKKYSQIELGQVADL